ncbi:unnamed protein product, partial [Polarella glacialis]
FLFRFDAWRGRAMPAKLTRGQLVEISGLKAPVFTPEEWRKETSSYDGPKEVNGQQGQLTEWDEEKGQWTVATFGADMVAVPESCLRPLVAEDLQDYDITLGPAS